MHTLQVHDLHKDYPTPDGPLHVLRGINLTLQAGDFLTIVGPSGSGKTTFLNMLTGVDMPTSGHVRIDDKNITHTPPGRLVKWRARHIGIVFQFFQLIPTLTVAENIMFPMDYARVHAPSERPRLAQVLLDDLGIGDQTHKTPDMLSGGQQQRAAIARALANNPAILIADEPTANLDRMSAETVFRLFQDVAARGAIVIMATYDYDIVRNAPRCLELDAGHLHEPASQTAR